MQAIIASNLAVTAVFAAWLMKVRLSVREWLAVAGVVIGVGLLGSSAGAEGAAKVGWAFQLGLIIAVAGVAVPLGSSSGPAFPNPARTPIVGAIAGLGYGVLAISARVLPSFAPAQLVRNPGDLHAGGCRNCLVHAVCGGAGRWHVTTATAAVILAETLPPALIGVLFLGDTTRPGLAVVAGFGFVLAVVCAVALARFGEAGEHAGMQEAGCAAGASRTRRCGGQHYEMPELPDRRSA